MNPSISRVPPDAPFMQKILTHLVSPSPTTNSNVITTPNTRCPRHYHHRRDYYYTHNPKMATVHISLSHVGRGSNDPVFGHTVHTCMHGFDYLCQHVFCVTVWRCCMSMWSVSFTIISNDISLYGSSYFVYKSLVIYPYMEVVMVINIKDI